MLPGQPTGGLIDPNFTTSAVEGASVGLELP